MNRRGFLATLLAAASASVLATPTAIEKVVKTLEAVPADLPVARMVPGLWHHITLVRTGASSQLYLDAAACSDIENVKIDFAKDFESLNFSTSGDNTSFLLTEGATKKLFSGEDFTIEFWSKTSTTRLAEPVTQFTTIQGAV